MDAGVLLRHARGHVRELCKRIPKHLFVEHAPPPLRSEASGTTCLSLIQRRFIHYGRLSNIPKIVRAQGVFDLTSEVINRPKTLKLGTILFL